MIVRDKHSLWHCVIISPAATLTESVCVRASRKEEGDIVIECNQKKEGAMLEVLRKKDPKHQSHWVSGGKIPNFLKRWRILFCFYLWDVAGKTECAVWTCLWRRMMEIQECVGLLVETGRRLHKRGVTDIYFCLYLCLGMLLLEKHSQFLCVVFWIQTHESDTCDEAEHLFVLSFFYAGSNPQSLKLSSKGCNENTIQ